MARALGDVLHYFLDGEPDEAAARTPAPAGAGAALLASPIACGDVLRAAFLWNLAVELARAGLRCAVLTPEGAAPDGIWPEPGRSEDGAEHVATGAAQREPFHQALQAWGAKASARPGPPCLGIVPYPAHWLPERGVPDRLAWWLLFATPDPEDQAAAVGHAVALLAAGAGTRVGLTLHGVHAVEQARREFERIAARVEAGTRRELLSYGLVAADLDVYRAIAQRAPVSATNAASPAARALRDAAAWIRADWRPVGADA